MYTLSIGNPAVADVAVIFSDIDSVGIQYCEWMSPVLSRHDIELHQDSSQCSLSDAVYTTKDRVAPTPTICVLWQLSDRRTLYFDNLRGGGGAATAAAVLADRGRTQSLHIIDRTPLGLTSIVFEYFDSSKFSSRSLTLMDDGNGVEFRAHGDPLSEEKHVLGGPAATISSATLMQICSALDVNLDVEPSEIRKCMTFVRRPVPR